MKKLGLVANTTKARAPEVLRRIDKLARGLRLQLVADEATAELLPGCRGLPFPKMAAGVDAIVALGGDGTVLRVVRALEGRDRPVIGVNIGGLGFLTSVAERQLGPALRCLARDDYFFSVRTIAEATVIRKGKTVAHYRALNDVVLDRGPSGRIVTLDVEIASQCVTSYMCDGLIVSTPTGSTAHSLSAGGPIITPDSRAMVISLICPHSLSSRPLVLPDTDEITITATEAEGEFILSVDGQVGQPILRGDCVKVRRSRRGVRLIHLPGYSYFDVLRQKLHWRGSSL